jgi:tetratricopeptide (TPR) repeat protein
VIEAHRQRIVEGASPADRRLPEGVALIRRASKDPCADLGPVEFRGRTRWEADRGIQLRAGIIGADAVFGLERRKCSEELSDAHEARGFAVRIDDADARDRSRLMWYVEDLRGLFKKTLLLLVIQGALIFVSVAYGNKLPGLQAPNGESPSEALASAATGVSLVFAWPLIALTLLRVLGWPQLLRTVGIIVLAATTGRTLVVWIAHLMAASNVGAAATEAKFRLLCDPVDWAILIAGIILGSRARALSSNAQQILPHLAGTVSKRSKFWSLGLSVVTGVYALTLLVFVGISRYETSAHLLHPGVDPRRENEALRALNEGLAQANRKDMNSAERSLQEALRGWEELTARPRTPSSYRVNLALTLHNLAWMREQEGRNDQAETYYSRAVALVDELGGDRSVDDDFKQTMNEDREVLAGLRRVKSSKLLDEKDRARIRTYEEALVEAQSGAVEAERLYQEAITAWEEVLPQADNPEYRKGAIGRLSLAHLRLGELQLQNGKRTAAEATLKKAIEYGERAVDLEPDRPLTKHNLEIAHQMLEELHEQTFQEELSKLCEERHYADAVTLCWRSIEDEERQARSGQGRKAAVTRLASRLSRFAWLLAHCPDVGIRDTRLAVEHARRAVELCPTRGSFWSTLTTVQYRNGDWRDSLVSLERVKTIEGGLDARGWFLNAMGQYQLGQREEARAAFQKGLEWVDALKRQAEDDAISRLQYELIQPSIEALRLEAEHLINVKVRST